MGTIPITLLILIVLLLLGLPIPFSFGLSAIYVFLSTPQLSGLLTSDGFEIISGYTIIAVPFFIYCGDLMNEAGIAAKLVDFSNIFTKKIKGALGHVTIISTLIFGAISGSSVAAVAAIGGIMFPRLVKQGYDRKYAAAMVSACGILDLLIPPNVGVIIFASVVPGASIKAIFLAGTIPGLILAFFFMVINHFAAARMPIVPYRRESSIGNQPDAQSRSGRVIVTAIPALLMPVIILGGIYGGIFTPTEAACVACVYSMVVGFWIYKSLNLTTFASATTTSVNTTGIVLCVLMFVFVMGRILIIHQMPQNLAAFMLSLTTNKFLLLFLICVFLIIMGMFMDAISGTIVCAPLLYPLVTELGLSTTHFGVFINLAFGVGLLTPPVAPCLFIGSKVANLPISEFMKSVLPFLYVSIILLFMVTYIPALSNFLPDLLGIK